MMAGSNTWILEGIGFLLFVFLGWYVGFIREEKLELGLWKLIDTVVYYIIPLLFTFIFFAVYSSR